MAIVFIKSNTPVKVGSLFIYKNAVTPVSTPVDITIPGVYGDIYLANVVGQLTVDDQDDLDMQELACVNAQEIDSDYYNDVLRISTSKNLSGPNINQTLQPTFRDNEGFNVESYNGFISVFPKALSHCGDVHNTEIEAWEWILTVMKSQPIARKWEIETPEACVKCLQAALLEMPLNSNSELISGWLFFEEGTHLDIIHGRLQSQFNLSVKSDTDAKAS